MGPSWCRIGQPQASLVYMCHQLLFLDKTLGSGAQRTSNDERKPNPLINNVAAL